MIRGVCVLGIIAMGAACAGRHAPVRSSFGITTCPQSAEASLLSPDALQCWFSAPNGRWRTLSHESHYQVLVVNIEAADLGDAESIARRFVSRERVTFSEILLYVQRESKTDGGTIRRVRWTPARGFESLDFKP